MEIRGIVKGNSIIFEEPLPHRELKEGDLVKVIVLPAGKPHRHFRTFRLAVKDDALDRERLYGEDKTAV